MRKAVAPIAIALLLAGAGLWLALRPSAPDELPDAPAASAAPQSQRRLPTALQDALRLAASAPQAGGALAGKVVGPGSTEAIVAIESGGQRRTAHVDAEGLFRFEGLPAGEYRLDASGGGASAEPLGPIPLGPGEQLADLVLQLIDAGSLSGTVLDARTRAPVAGAQLAAGGAMAVSDDAGRFELRGLPPSDATLVISRAGYVSRSARLSVGRGSHESGATFLLTPAAHVSGKVVQADGSPASGALVFAERYEFGPVSDAQVLGSAGDDGRFEGDVEPGRMRLRASAHNGEARSEEMDLRAGERRDELLLTVDVGGEIEGTVLEADGKPAGDARVFAVEIQTQRAAPAVAAGGDGHFRVSGLPEGVYTVIARSGARTAERSGLRIEPGDVQHAELHFGTATLDGRVVDAAGRPLVGAQVSVSPEGATPVPAGGVESGAGGAFKLEGLSGTRFALKATHPSGTAELHGVPAGASGVELRIAAQSAIQGVVLDEGGQGVSEFLVVAEPVAPGLQGGARATGRFASAGGDFKLSCAPGRYRLRVAATGYAAVDAGEVDAPANGSSGVVRITVRGTRTLTGTVVDAQTHAPIAGARVATRAELMWAFGRANAAHLGTFTTTSADGSFTIPDADKGDLNLFASADGHGWAPPLRVPAGANGPFTLALPPGSPHGPESFAGVGMQIGPDYRISTVFEGGPADLAGLRNGDILLSVDGAAVAGRNLNDVIGQIRGEVGTPVAIGVSRGGQQLTLVPTRAEIKF